MDNYRGDHLIQTAGGGRRRRAAGRRGRRSKGDESHAANAKSGTDVLAALIDFKLSICPDFIIKLGADEAPLSFYVEQAIQRGKPLYHGCPRSTLT